jgi:hypothetical protein
MIAFHRDTKRPQPIPIVLGEGRGTLAFFGLFSIGFFGRDFIQTDRGLKHQQNVKSMFSNILHDTGDLLAFDHRFVDGLAPAAV